MPSDHHEAKDAAVTAGLGRLSLTGQTTTAVGVVPLPDAHPFYAVVGRIAAEWAQMEHAPDLIIWDLLGAPQDLGSCVTQQLSGYRSRFIAITALSSAHGLGKDLTDKITALQGRTQDLAVNRNRFVHGAWFMTQPEEDLAQFKSLTRRQRKFGIEAISDDDARQTINRIREKVEEITNLRAEISPARRALP
ncbi:MAG: hypothetical protein ACREFU_18875 [Acetobacteraceae bacterium]